MPTVPSAVRVLAGMAILVVAACDASGSTPATPEPTSTPDLAGTTWALTRIGENPPAVTGDAWLRFGENGEIAGSTGCNNLVGNYAVDGNALTFGMLGSTKKACPDDDLMAQDASVPEALTNVTGWHVDGDGRLHLTGGTELVFEPRAT